MPRRKSRIPDNSFYRLVRRLARRPCNRNGADKTWVLDAMVGVMSLIDSARLISRGKSHARIR